MGEVLSRFKWLYLFVTFMIVYSPFFGYVYLKGYLTGAGFNGANIDPSIQELIFQCALGLQYIVLGVFNDGELISKILISALLVGGTLAVFMFLGSIFLSFEKVVSKDKGDTSPAFKEIIKAWLSRYERFVSRAAIGMVFVFFAGFISQFIAFLAILVGLSATWLVMQMGFIIGLSEGKSVIDNMACATVDWKAGETRRLGCDAITLANKTELVGVRLYSSKSMTFFITNDGAYEIDSKKIIVKYRPIQQREPEAKPEK